MQILDNAQANLGTTHSSELALSTSSRPAVASYAYGHSLKKWLSIDDSVRLRVDEQHLPSYGRFHVLSRRRRTRIALLPNVGTALTVGF
jgi:hypothetical protein